MPDRQWLITNRTVGVKPDGTEVVTDEARESLPIFRVGLFDPAKVSKKSTFLDAQRAVSIIPDEYVESYKDLNLIEGRISGQNGTRRMFAELYRAMCESPPEKGDTLLFIHGFNYSFTSAMKHFRRLYDLYVAPPSSPIGRIIYFTWPSYGRRTHYPLDRAIAGPSGWLLARLFHKASLFHQENFGVHAEPHVPHCGRKIHLAVHSMGGQVLREFVRAVQDSGFNSPALFGQALLLHADLEWQALECDEPLHRLSELCDRIHVYNHKDDIALGVSETTKNPDKRLGRHGPRNKDRIGPRTVIVDCTRRSSRDRIPSNDAFYGEIESIVEPSLPLREVAFRHWGYLYCARQISDIYAVLAGWPSEMIEEINGSRERVVGPLYRLT